LNQQNLSRLPSTQEVKRSKQRTNIHNDEKNPQSKQYKLKPVLDQPPLQANYKEKTYPTHYTMISRYNTPEQQKN
jgi:hypothetical protein